jgi:hypothetical protein
MRPVAQFMTKKNILPVSILVLLGILCIYVYKDRFLPQPIRISHRSVEPRATRRRPARDSQTETVVFLLNPELKLTALKVVPLGEINASQTPHPIWELISDSNSVPVKEFMYGQRIRGMRPPRKGAAAEPLQPNIPYRLFITAGRRKAQYDFTAVPRKS